MKVQLILTACFVTLGSTSVQPHQWTEKQLRNLFNSVAKNDARRSNVYRETLTKEVVRQQKAFDIMSEAVHSAQTRYSDRKRNSDRESNSVHNKREIHRNHVTMIRDTDHFDRELSLLPETTLAVVCYSHQLCEPCQEIAPLYDELPQKYENVTFLKVDVEECEDLAELQTVETVPTFIFYRNRQELFCLCDTSIEEVERKILEHF